MKRLASQKISSELKQLIENKVWNPGDKLPALTKLARDYGVGISSLREALKVLETQGYIFIEHGRGVFVRNKTYWKQDAFDELTELPGGDIISLLEFRLLLEPRMAALAAERGSPGQLVKIKSAAQQMLANVLKGEDFFEADIAFHDYIAEASSNPVMAKVMKGISDMLVESRWKTSRIAGTIEKATYFHMLIALAIEQRNVILAYELMETHLNDVSQDLTKQK